MYRRLMVITVLVSVVFSATGSLGQGISSILERLDSLESNMADLGTSLANTSSETGSLESVDLTVYDVSLSKIEKQLASLDAELLQIKDREVIMAPNSDVEERLVELEQSSQAMIPLLKALKASQAEGFAKIQVAMVANAEPVPPAAIVCAPPAVEQDFVIEDLVLSGFVDASFFYDGQSQHGSFGLDQVEIDAEKSLGPKGSLRFDLEWASDGEGGFVPEVEQGFVTYSPSSSCAGAFTFGKFNAPIGFELLDAPDMYQYSHALVFDNGLPTNLTGLMYTAPIKNWDLAAYICNGWDVNVDPDKDKTIGGRIGFNGDSWGGIGFSAIHGTETVFEDDLPAATTKLTVFDVDLSYNPLENWTLGGEVNIGNNDLGEESAEWWGFLVMSHWDFNATYGTTIRFDYFDDKDNSRLGAEKPEVRQAIAVAPTFVLGDGMGALIEARWDFSDQDVFTDCDDLPTSSAFNFAFEMTYTF